MRDYTGDEWVGTSHKRKRAGLVAHDACVLGHRVADRPLQESLGCDFS